MPTISPKRKHAAQGSATWRRCPLQIGSLSSNGRDQLLSDAFASQAPSGRGASEMSSVTSAVLCNERSALGSRVGLLSDHANREPRGKLLRKKSI